MFSKKSKVVKEVKKTIPDTQKFHWIEASDGVVPEDSLAGGHDANGQVLFVGRAEHRDSLTPGTLNPARSALFLSWGCIENIKQNYEVLIDDGCFTWMPAVADAIPNNAVIGGKTENGEKLYIGRVPIEGTITIGKVEPSHKVCYIPFQGYELIFDEYEILVRT